MSGVLPPPPAALAPAVKGLLARADQWESVLGARPELARLVYYSRFAAASASARLASSSRLFLLRGRNGVLFISRPRAARFANDARASPLALYCPAAAGTAIRALESGAPSFAPGSPGRAAGEAWAGLLLSRELLERGQQNPAVVAIEQHLIASLVRRIRKTNQTIQGVWKAEAAPAPQPRSLGERLRALFGA